MMPPEFVERIVEDLRRFSAPLLEAGIAPRKAGVWSGGEGSLGVLLGTIDRFHRLLPSLVGESARENRLSRRFAHRSAPIPRRARASRSPWDYQQHEDRLLPVRWVTVEPLPVPEPSAISYLRALTARLAGQLEGAAGRLEKYFEDARAARSEASPHARAEIEELDRTRARIRRARSILVRSDRSLRDQAPHAVGARLREPRPYPIAKSWRALRDLAPRILDPASTLPEWLGALLSTEVGATDLAYLYQRWCGVQIIEALGRLGFRPRRDPTGALFLGEQGVGCFDASGVPISFWCEPRLLRGREHPTGLAPARDLEKQPDYVLLCPGDRGPDAYILDATLSQNRELLEQKGEYRSSLVFERRRLVAGVPTNIFPVRSWAIAPIRSDRCRFSDPEGRRGVVPLHPEAGPRALESWLEDVVRGARAWHPGS